MVIPKTLKMNNGIEIPMLGLGTSMVGNGKTILKKNDNTMEDLDEKTTQSVRDAIDVGYRHIDCAWFYGNESAIGKGVNEKIRDGTIKRCEIFITTKLWNSFHARASVVRMLRDSLNNLKLDYIDLFLIHFPFGYKEDGPLLPIGDPSAYCDIDYIETWQGMEDCVKLGIAKTIGLSNFNSEQVERVLQNCQIKPAVNQIEVNPNMNQKSLVQFCQSKGLVVIGYSPLGRSELLGTPGFPTPTILDPRVAEIAKKHNKTPAQVVLNYLIAQNVAVIPKSVKKSRLIENSQIFDFHLDKEDADYLDSLNKDQQVNPLTLFSDHKYFPFKTKSAL